MMKLIFTLVLSISLLNGIDSLRGSVANHLAYRDVSSSSLDNLIVNLDIYNQLLATAASEDADFLVFPEFGLAPGGTNNRTALRETSEQIGQPTGQSPCDTFSPEQQQRSPIMYKMSCAAKENQVAALVNMIEYVPCESADEDCPKDGYLLYNTNVGFTSTGEFQMKYHKGHEYFGLKPQFNVPSSPDYQTWVLRGVEFGIFTCYDIMFKDPAKKYIENGLHNILYPVQMGSIGDITEISHWSKKQKATMFVANTCLDTSGPPKCSAVYVDGKKQEGSLVGIVNSEDIPSTQDSVLVVEV